MQCAAIIPARGGSKRVKNKNLLNVAGHPLIAWTIEAALDAWSIDAVFVSTDSDEIAHVARTYGAEVIERPAVLALDTAPTEPVLLHALDWLLQHLNLEPEYLALLQCTSPLRPFEVINRGVEMIVETSCDSVVGVHPTIDWFFAGRIENGRFEVDYDPLHRPRTQDINPKYRENGSTYVTRSDFLRRTGCRMGGDMRPLVMSAIQGLDIDEAQDLAVAAWHLQHDRRYTGNQPVVRLG